MFKLTYQAFIMMGVVGGFAWGKVLDRSKEILVAGRLAGLFCLGAITAGMMIFPVKAFSSYYGSFAEYRGLDGEAWIATTKPEYAGMVEYLKKNRDGKNLAEAVGDSYSLLNLVSVFSGTPSIQGWRVHEWLWRGGYDIVAKRQAEVEEIYQGISREETGRIIQKYRLGWIVVGPDERLLYRVNEEKLWTLGKIVWQDGESYLLKITESSPADW